MKRWQSEHFEAPVQIGPWLDRREQEVLNLTVVSITGCFADGWLVVFWYEEAVTK